MKQIYPNHLAYKSFWVDFLKSYYNRAFIIKGFFISLLLSSFIYLEHFGASFWLFEAIFAIAGFAFLIDAKKEEVFWFGFFIGLFWFYWISLSFRYYDLTFLIPFVVLVICVICAILFGIAGLFKNLFFRSFFIFSISFISPFGFNWIKLELSLLNTPFANNNWKYLIFLESIALFIYLLKNNSRFISVLAIVPLLFSINLNFFDNKNILLPDIKIFLYDQQLPQQDKWNKENIEQILDKNFAAIEKAADEGYDLIVLNEAAFPLYLNREIEILDRLKKLSFRISIVTGGLFYENEFKNSSYFFQNGKFQIAHKVVLVPFGESVPLPKFLAKLINKIFFNGAEDFSASPTVVDFEIYGVKFRNAICYEASTDEIFAEKNGSKKGGYMVAISNNGWFVPSIEPTLQSILLKFYARKYNTTIFHSANMGISQIIIP